LENGRDDEMGDRAGAVTRAAAPLAPLGTSSESKELEYIVDDWATSAEDAANRTAVARKVRFFMRTLRFKYAIEVRFRIGLPASRGFLPTSGPSVMQSSIDATIGISGSVTRI
jgi:hypothetical protein